MVLNSYPQKIIIMSIIKIPMKKLLSSSQKLTNKQEKLFYIRFWIFSRKIHIQESIILTIKQLITSEKKQRETALEQIDLEEIRIHIKKQGKLMIMFSNNFLANMKIKKYLISTNLKMLNGQNLYRKIFFIDLYLKKL